MKKDSTQEKMAADDKIVAFDFQFHYFSLQYFSLKINESVGFESKEDVHLDHIDGKSTFIQVKHTAINQNITNKDEALWKTIWSWINIIKDNAEGRKSINKQLEFVNNSTFLLLTNKHNNENNEVLKKIVEFKEKKINIDDLINSFKLLIRSTKHSEIDKKILVVTEHSKNVLSAFFNNIKFNTDFEDIDQKIRIRLTEIYVPTELQSGMIEAIYYKLKIMLSEVVYQKTHLVLSQQAFSEIVNKYNRASYVKRIVVNKNFDILEEVKPSSDMLFIKQLEEIEELNLSDSEDEEYILKLYENKLLYETNRMRWIQESELPEMDIEEIENQAREVWVNEFHRMYGRRIKNKLDEEEFKDKARDLFYEVKKTELEFSMAMSPAKKLGQGVFLYLSDVPTIGWHCKWKERYGDANL